MPTWVDKILNSQSVQLGLAAVAFLIALLLVIVIARMLMGGRLRLPGGRARQARLGIVDAFDLDRQRQLIIVRRDNTEHLIMIGGPNDLVIESEIVRVEARDFRDSRRDKSFEGVADGRIAARIGVSNGDGQVPAEAIPSRADEPLPPLDLAPGAPSTEGPKSTPTRSAPAVEPPPRGPTFPLPPRRPVPAPERRSPPPLPDSVSRTDDQPSPAPAAIVAVPSPAPTPAPQPPPAPSPAASMPAAAVRPPPPRPSILKPLPPRPPIRPLKRTTPQADGPTTSAAPLREEPAAPLLPTAPEAASAPAPTPPRAPSLQPPKPERPNAPPADADKPSPPATVAPEADALESLEEEMAKLLGRG